MSSRSEIQPGPALVERPGDREISNDKLGSWDASAAAACGLDPSNHDNEGGLFLFWSGRLRRLQWTECLMQAPQGRFLSHWTPNHQPTCQHNKPGWIEQP